VIEKLLRARWFWVALVGVGALIVLVLVVTAGGGTDRPTPGQSATPSMSAEQQTLLVQVRNDDDLGADNVIVGVDGGLPTTQVLVPSRLVVDPPGSAPQTLARTASGLDRTASQDSLRDLLALRIDGTLSLARLALAGMVDFVGGIMVDVDTTITTVDESTGQKVVVVPAGSQHLDGTQAAAYALAWLPDEPETARLQRWSQVLTATVSELPDDPLRIEQMLTSLGGSARTTVSTSLVGAFLLRMRAGIQAGGQQVQVLPTLAAEGAAEQPASGAGSATADGSSASPTPSPSPPEPAPGAGPDQLSLVRLDLPAAQPLLEQVLPTALLASDDATPRVLVLDGVGQPGLSAAAHADLSADRLVAIEGGNAEQLSRTRTTIEVGSGTAGTALGAQVAEALGVPESQVESTSDLPAGADAVVVLGSDFEP
jgi:hypothetical protein